MDYTLGHAGIDPLSLAVYALFFGVTVFLTSLRPAYGLAVLLFIQPFAFYRDVGHTTVTLPKIALAAVLLVMLYRRTLFSAFTQASTRSFAIAIAVVVSTTALSYLQAAHHESVIRETLKWIEYLLLFAAVYAAFTADPDVALAGAAAAASASVVAIVALSQDFSGAPSVLLAGGSRIPRIAGPLEGPNQLAGYFDTAIPLLFALCAFNRNYLYGFALFIGCCADVLTFSRGGAISAAAGIALCVILLRKDAGWKFAASWTAAGVSIGIGGALCWAAYAKSFEIFRVAAAHAYNTGGVGTRAQLWSAAFDLWKRHPLLGVGAGNFEFEISEVGPKNVRTHANSLYLQTLVEQGILGLAAMLFLIYRAIAQFCVRPILRHPLVIGALAATVALALHQTADFLIFFPKVGGWWFCVLGLGAGASSAAAKK